MMTEVSIRVAKAEPTVDPVTNVIIHIGPETIRNITEYTYETDSVAFTEQAKRVEQALWLSLPGGTYDELLMAMLERRRSRLVIAHKP